MSKQSFDALGRFILAGYDARRPFASFLPGIAGPLGIPMWVFYANRGQGITSFGVESKDRPIMEFQPANKAYWMTSYVGFRTFLKLRRSGQFTACEPFSPADENSQVQRNMYIGMNELEIEEVHPALGIQTNILYFMLPNESFSGLVRQVTIQNISNRSVEIEVLDGMPVLAPYGANNPQLKDMSRTLEAWMEVFNLSERVPFFRLRASAADGVQVETYERAHFALAWFVDENWPELLPALVDPVAVFEHDTAFSTARGFYRRSLEEFSASTQVTVGRTPCAFFAGRRRLAPRESLSLASVYGHTHRTEALPAIRKRLLEPGFLAKKRQQANQIVSELTLPIETHTASAHFDAYCRQTFLDNVLRGGVPVALGDPARPHIYHLYSRKHGDPERDYNAFYLAAEYYSQGNGNYRDVNQNRRSDAWFYPAVGTYNLRTFLSLIQLDGYNPLVVQGSRFFLPADQRSAVLAHVTPPEVLASILDKPFTPGSLLTAATAEGVSLDMPPETFLNLALRDAVQQTQAVFGEGFWTDHWVYNLDMIDNFLSIYPDQKESLLFGDPGLPFYESPVLVQPRSRKIVLVGDKVRQYGAVHEDAEKAAQIAGRAESSTWMCTRLGQGEIYRADVFAHLLLLALIKFATLDPGGLGVEMEAGRPGWSDAMNGLPGLFGSSVPEAYSLQELLAFLLEAARSYPDRVTRLPVEAVELLHSLESCLASWQASAQAERDYVLWDGLAHARELYRQKTRLGLDGAEETFELAKLSLPLQNFLDHLRAKLQQGVELNGGLPPTYWIWEVTESEPILDAQGKPACDLQQHPYVRPKSFTPKPMPPFLEGMMRALRAVPDQDQASAKRIFESVRSSPLYDEKLGMYKVNASLEVHSHEIGRARAFPTGWLENESIWLHMEYKYLYEVLRAGLAQEFFEMLAVVLVPFQDPDRYGRSPLENSSFIASSAHPDETLHGAGFVARLSGSTAEFLSIWQVMMAGEKPFFMIDGALSLKFQPTLPGWLFAKDKRTGSVPYISFRFLDHCLVTYYNPERSDLLPDKVAHKIALEYQDGSKVETYSALIPAHQAEQVRSGLIVSIQVYY